MPLSSVHPAFCMWSQKPLMRTGVASVVLAMLTTVSGCAHMSGGSLPAPHCSDTVQTTVNASHKTLTVAYTEPSVNQAGHPLKELAKTSVYYDLGDGRVLAKDVPSTKPTGGGQITETITLPITQSKDTLVRLCVTATDQQGHESAMTP